MSSELEIFDDLESYNRTMEKAMGRAEEIIAMKARGITPEEEIALKKELPILVRNLRAMLKTQLAHNSSIVQMDLADGSYDNLDTDEKLRKQLSVLRDLNTDIARGWGTKTIRKFSAWFREDIPAWLSVKGGVIMDYFRQFLPIAGVIGGVTAAGYMIANKGVVPGLQHMQKDADWVLDQTARPVARWFGENADPYIKNAADLGASVLLGPDAGQQPQSMDWLKFGADYLMRSKDMDYNGVDIDR